ncbi:hypothetical protein [Gluconobacter thailandicus]|uniref:DUF4214 domain-containing protein n=1 Tax=Gluconobacter thailandicus TaxID=257438 RepID=A0AAP9ES90_GLUTH|nr:hypothetical protein [Gluconobacter thailandicus]QEH96801.1 hypothetical protein FXF46_11180 [Gluconobacter thailandicus]
MTDNSFFPSLTPDAQKETNLLLGGGTIGSSDQHHSVTGMPPANQTHELFSGTNSGSTQGKSTNDFGSGYDYHRNSPAVQAAIQKLKTLSFTGSQTTDAQTDTASVSSLTADGKSVLLNSSVKGPVKTTDVFVSRAALPTTSLYSASYDEPGNGGSSSSGGDSGGGSASNPSLVPAGPTGAALANSMNKIFYDSRDQIARDYHGGSLTQVEMNSCYREMEHLITHKHWAGFRALHHVEVEISRWASTTQNYQNMIQDVTGTAATDTDKAWIKWAEDTIANSVGKTSPYTGNTREYTYQDARYNLVHSDRVTGIINQAYQWELGRAPDTSELASQQNALTNGQTITDIRRSIAFSGECTQDLRNEIVAVTGTLSEADNGWIQWVQNTMVQNPGWSLDSARSNLAHSDRVTNLIKDFYRNELAREADSAGIASYENGLANNEYNYLGVMNALAYSGECRTYITDIYNNSGISCDNDDISSTQADIVEAAGLSQGIFSPNQNTPVAPARTGWQGTDAMPPNVTNFVLPDGRTILKPNNVSAQQVFEQGQRDAAAFHAKYGSSYVDYLSPAAIHSFESIYRQELGQNGTFDAQRNIDQSGYLYRKLTPWSNYIIGVYSAGWNLPEPFMVAIGRAYADYKGGNGGRPENVTLWVEGRKYGK